MMYQTPRIVPSGASTAAITSSGKNSSCTETHGGNAKSSTAYEVDE